MNTFKERRRVDGFSIYLTRAQAQAAYSIFWRGEHSKLGAEIQKNLRDVFVYEVKCAECPKVYEYCTQEELSGKDLKKPGLCSDCQEDNK